jgi:hypothetical protein
MYANVDFVMVVGTILFNVSTSPCFREDINLQSTIASQGRETFWRYAGQEQRWRVFTGRPPRLVV